MNWNIRYPKDMIAKAAEKGKELVTFGFNGKGRMEFQMFMSEETTTFLTFFVHELNQGYGYDEAFAAAKQKLADAIKARDERVAAKKLAAASKSSA